MMSRRDMGLHCVPETVFGNATHPASRGGASMERGSSRNFGHTRNAMSEAVSEMPFRQGVMDLPRLVMQRLGTRRARWIA
jgi:hypothetical protein